MRLQNEIIRKERIPLDDVRKVDNEIFQAIAGILKANCDKMLTRELINEIFSQFRQIGENMMRDQ